MTSIIMTPERLEMINQIVIARHGAEAWRSASYDGETLSCEPTLATLIAPIEAELDAAGDPASIVGLLMGKRAKVAAVNAKRDAIIAGGYQHNFGATAGIRTLDQRDAKDETAWLTVKINAMEAVSAGAGTTQLPIRDANNETFTVSATVASSAMTAMAQWRTAVSQHSWDLKDAIADAVDAAGLAAIDIETGWPE